MKNNKPIIYQTKSGAIELRGDTQNETIWATQAEIAHVFGVTPQNITMHIRNIYKDKELQELATCKEYLQVRHEGSRVVKRKVREYNLDVVIATGYRINSVMGTRFRQWATKTLRAYITNGYVINRSKIRNNYEAFMKAVADIQNLLPEHINLDPKAVLDLIREFACTWVSLDAYDKESLKTKGVTKKNVTLTGDELTQVVSDLRRELISKNEATELFAVERDKGSLSGIIGNVMQMFDGKALYETTEEKAAHLLYFIVKNHPFVDGNKRSGAFAFIWFLRKFKVKGHKNINPATLTALTLFIAESDPKKKDLMVGLVIQLLKQ
jgi:prophage maintenance system killer protein